MPSITAPLSVLASVNNGPNPPGGGGGNGGAAEVAAHISDPLGAHAASAISYAGGPNWANASTNPAATTEAQLDKIISDLAGATASTSGDNRIGVEPATVGTVTLASGTLRSRLVALQDAANINFAGGEKWLDDELNPPNNVEDQFNKIVLDLGEGIVGDGASGAGRIGVSQRLAWQGGRANPGAISVQAALNKIISDLSATTASDDGAERIGASAAGSLLTDSVRGQLNELDTLWGKLNRVNAWTNTQNVNGPPGDTNPVFVTDFPTARKLLWRFKNRTVFVDIFTRIYNDAEFGGLVVTDNAFWDGTNWQGDDTTVPATLFRFDGDSQTFEIYANSTAVPWGAANWGLSGGQYARYGTNSVFLGNTTVSGPASIICTIDAENGKLRFSNSANAAVSDTNPPSTQGHFNELRAKNIVKAWGSVLVGAGYPTPEVSNGFNIASCSYSGGTSSLVVNLQADMANTYYVVVATGYTATAHTVTWHNRAVGSFRISVFDAAGSKLDLDTGGEVITFMVIGEQDS